MEAMQVLDVIEKDFAENPKAMQYFMIYSEMSIAME